MWKCTNFKLVLADLELEQPGSSHINVTDEMNNIGTDDTQSRKKTNKKGKAYRQLLDSYAETTKENATELQNNLLNQQREFIGELFKQQQNFEKDMMVSLVNSQRQTMIEMTNSLLTGLKNIFQPQPSPYVLHSTPFMHNSTIPSPNICMSPVPSTYSPIPLPRSAVSPSPSNISESTSVTPSPSSTPIAILQLPSTLNTAISSPNK